MGKKLSTYLVFYKIVCYWQQWRIKKTVTPLCEWVNKRRLFVTLWLKWPGVFPLTTRAGGCPYHRTVCPKPTTFVRCYHKSILQLRTSVLGRLRDFQYIFAVIYETLCTLVGKVIPLSILDGSSEYDAHMYSETANSICQCHFFYISSCQI